MPGVGRPGRTVDRAGRVLPWTRVAERVDELVALLAHADPLEAVVVQPGLQPDHVLLRVRLRGLSVLDRKVVVDPVRSRA